MLRGCSPRGMSRIRDIGRRLLVPVSRKIPGEVLAARNRALFMLADCWAIARLGMHRGAGGGEVLGGARSGGESVGEGGGRPGEEAGGQRGCCAGI